MRKTNQEIDDAGALEEVLQFATVCRIAMRDEETPYLLPFNFGYSDKVIYIHSAPDGKKIDLLMQNNRVTFEVEDPVELITHEKSCGWSSYYRSVTGTGIMEIITDHEQKKKGLEIIMRQHGANGPFTFEKEQVDRMVILKLTINSMTGKQSGNRKRIRDRQTISIETERLHMKELTMEDLEDFHRLSSCPEVDEFNTVGIPADINESEIRLRRIVSEHNRAHRKIYTWKIILKGSGKFIGIAGYTFSLDRFRLGEIYYNLLPEYWGNGYATEVAKRMIRLGFEEFKLHKVEAGVDTENTRSVKVLEKAGMTREGLRRKILPIRGVWKDNYHYAILESDLKNL